MEVQFLIENKETDGSSDVPKLGISEAYIQEGINQVTLIELFVVSDAELDEDACEKLIGQNVMVALKGVVNNGLVVSRYDGIIFELLALDDYKVERGIYGYRIIIRPPLWKLNFQTQHRSIANASRVDAIDEILQGHKLEKSVNYDTCYFDAGKDYPALSQIIQNEITDLVFLQQLMSEGGINYYFSAPKDGETPEMAVLADHNVFFKNVWKKDVLWNPPEGMVGKEPQVTSLETHMHTTPAKVTTTADLGDGMVQTFTETKQVPDGKGGEHTLFGREGEDENVSAHTASVLTDSFTASKVTYKGQSNHLAIRSGEKVNIKGDSAVREKAVLITSVRHTLKQSVQAAMRGTSDLKYENVFSANRMDAPIRPPQIGAAHLGTAVNSKRDMSPLRNLDTLIKHLKEELDVELDLDTAEYPFFNGHQILLNLLDRLVKSSSSTGVMVAEVIGSAIVTEQGELTCRIANQQFPETDSGGGLTAKVSLGWLTKQGWHSLLPRKGNFVYFMFMQGEGGQNEPVVIGYRSTGVIKTLDPDKTQITPKLKVGSAPALGEAAETVVEKDEYEPSNRHRNTLQGEDGVAEVAVIDSGENSVAIHANNGIHMVADQEVHVDAPVQCENADELHQQFGLVNRGVIGDQKESIGGKHEQTVMGDQEEFVGGSHKRHVEEEIRIDNNGNDDITIANGDDNTLVLHKGEQAVLKADDKNYVSIANSGVIDAQSGDAVNIGAGKHTVVTNQDGITLTVGSNSITISRSGSVDVAATGVVSVSGAQVKIEGKASVAITGSAEVSVKGGMINLN